MERRDIMVIAGAVLVVLILAVVVKPMLTGQAPNLGLPEAPAPVASIEPIGAPTGQQTSPPPGTSVPETPPPTPSSEVTPNQTGESQTGQKVPEPVPTSVSWQPDPENPMPAIQMTEYADIVGKYTGSTAPFRIPTPYWELSYNVTPSGDTPVFLMDVVEKGIAGADDKTIRSYVYRQGKIPDPKEGRFFEGGRDYYLRVISDQIEKYQVKISIPLKYIPDN
jgi:hypothetical protein